MGYGRISTHEQTLDLQIDQLQATGCAPYCIGVLVVTDRFPTTLLAFVPFPEED